MEFGETFEDAVRREIFEEYGVVPEEVKHVSTHNVIRNNQEVKTHWIAVLHVAKVNPKEVTIGDPDKMEEIGWFSSEAFPQGRHSMFDSHFEMVKSYL